MSATPHMLLEIPAVFLLDLCHVGTSLPAKGGARGSACCPGSLPAVWFLHQLQVSRMHTLPLLCQTCSCTACADWCCSVLPAGSGLDISGPASTVGALSVLAAIVAIHECGHFVAARLQNIHVTKFSIGFGPALLKWQASWQPLASKSTGLKTPSSDGGQMHCCAVRVASRASPGLSTCSQ